MRTNSTPQPETDESWDDLLRAEITALTPYGGWAWLADLRTNLDRHGIPREMQDHHLLRLARGGRLYLAPVGRPATSVGREPSGPAEKAAAIWTGNEYSEIVTWPQDNQGQPRRIAR